MLTHGRILTSVERAHRHVATLDICCRFKTEPKFLVNVFRDCISSSAIWKAILPLSKHNAFFTANDENSFSWALFSEMFADGIRGQQLFLTTCWFIYLAS
ncbi:hypothetical protein M5689_003442 [Euphorbia peplus]|nr:hypothetical protein M5689_003442 [Euphorbia peplus]